MARESFTSVRAKFCPMQFLEETGKNMRYLLSELKNMNNSPTIVCGGMVAGTNIQCTKSINLKYSPAYLGPAENGMNAYGDMSFEFSVVKRIGSNVCKLVPKINK